MADYDLQYQDTHIDVLLATANELKTAGYIYKGVATPSTNPGTPTERVAYLASEPGTYTNFGGIVITSGLYSLTYVSGTWTGTQMQAGSDIEVVQTTGQSTSDVMSQKAVTDALEETALFEDSTEDDLFISDDNGNVLVQFSDGHIKVKNFDSEKAPQCIDYSNGDYGICDDNGNVLVQFSDGHIKVKNFDSRNISPSDVGSYWKNKKIAFLGDSITQQAKYIDAYVNLTGCIALNYGVSGEHLAKISASVNKDFESRVPSMDSDVDMVIVFGGTNDFGHTTTATPFGELGDGPKGNYFTFCAGVHRLFKSLDEKYRGKPVVVMTPVHHGIEIDQPEYTQPNGTSITTFDNSFIEHPQVTTGKTFREYVDMIKIIAQFYSFVVIDAYSFSGLNPIMEIGSANRYYFSDGLHLSTLGGNKLAQWMYPHLERVYKMFY